MTWRPPIWMLLVVVFGGGLFFSYCHGNAGPAAQVERYRQELVRWTLSPPSNLPSWPEAPTRRAWRKTVPEFRLPALALLTLQGCRLGELVGERNSQLGKLKSPERVLRYEQQLIRAIGTCSVPDPELARNLEMIAAAKRGTLGQRYHNAIWTTHELHGMLSSRETFTDGDVSAASQALRDITRLITNPQNLDNPDATLALDRALRQLQQSRAAGALFFVVSRVLDELISATQSLEVAVEARQCEHSAHLRRTFRHHYVGNVQPRLAQLDRQLEDLGAALWGLFVASQERLTRGPESLRVYAAASWSPNDASLRQALKLASVNHAAAWQQIERRCNLNLLPLSEQLAPQ